jgi:protein-S-isoprenylcysteine O-methyltransferase Ste14
MTILTIKAFAGLLLLLLVMAACLFVPAWTLGYWQAWTFLAVFGTSTLVITLYLVKKDPGLLARRLYAGPSAEKQTGQKIVQSLTSLAFVAMLAVPALDHRLAWSAVPAYVCFAGDAFVALGFLIVFLVYRANSFASATIEIYANQRVISTGPYALVRHPMYVGGLIMFVGGPLSLGSWWGLLPIVLMMPALIWRLLDEEELLTKELQGYKEYKDNVRFRLVPFVW